jgi:hypothetical protein
MHIADRREFLALVGCGALLARPRSVGAAARRFKEIGRLEAAEARQGVAVDAAHVYAVIDTQVGKYDKTTHELVARGTGPSEGLPIHLDSGVVVGEKLYCAHSNYPGLPMTSSVEIWDTPTMKHAGSHSFGVHSGSLTWIDRHEGYWWAVFANYSRVFGPSPQPYGNTRWTVLEKFDDSFRTLSSWIFPEPVLRRVEPMSISGGSWGPDGLLYCTGHDAPELYVMRLPEAGSVLELAETVPFAGQGQGIAWDRTAPGVLYGIIKAERTVVVSQLDAS